MEPGEIVLGTLRPRRDRGRGPGHGAGDVVQLRFLRPGRSRASSATSSTAKCATSWWPCRWTQDLAYYRERSAAASACSGWTSTRRRRVASPRALADQRPPGERPLPLRLLHRPIAPPACATASTRRSTARCKPQLAGRSQRQHLPQRIGAPGLAGDVDVAGLRHRPAGRTADRPLSRWDESFMPMRLRDALREAKRADGTPLVLAEVRVLAQSPRRATRRHAALARAGAVRRPRAGDRGAAIGQAPAAPAGRAGLAGLDCCCGLLGATMVFIWLGSAPCLRPSQREPAAVQPAVPAAGAGWLVAWRADARPRRRFRVLLWLVAGARRARRFPEVPALPAPAKTSSGCCCCCRCTGRWHAASTRGPRVSACRAGRGQPMMPAMDTPLEKPVPDAMVATAWPTAVKAVAATNHAGTDQRRAGASTTAASSGSACTNRTNRCC